jgi:hypothetical protein
MTAFDDSEAVSVGRLSITLVHGTWGRGIFPDTIGRLCSYLRVALRRLLLKMLRAGLT